MRADPVLQRPARNGHEEIHAEMRERIALLVYPPGTMLSENRLAEEFGVSRTPIRRVLHRLEFEGLISVKHGVGTIVTPIDMVYLKQVYELRFKLIDLIAELSPAHVSAGDLAILEGLLGEARALRAEPDTLALARLYLRFSEELLRAIGNRPLREIADRLFHQTSRVWFQLLPAMDWDEEVDAIVDEIGEVLAALRARDMRRVSETRRRHFEACLQRINRHLSGSGLSLA